MSSHTSESQSQKEILSVSHRGRENLATLNFTPGKKIYGEDLVKVEGREYRLWDPFRSKLAAAILKGLSKDDVLGLRRVLYLGASTGTTVSHLSDVTGEKGKIFAVEVAQRVGRELVENVARTRRNVIPLIEDARYPERYRGIIPGKMDAVYCDLAQRDQTEIAVKNCEMYLRDEGVLFLIVKTRSIDVAKDPSEIFASERSQIRAKGFSIMKAFSLEPFDKDHYFIEAIYHDSE